MSKLDQLEGFDPLGHVAEIEDLPGDPTKPVVLNVLNSYTGFYDLFSELIQNALDATQAKFRQGAPGYAPRIFITVDMQSRVVRVVDNGVGMSLTEFKYCLRPNISYKRGTKLRGNKGVGATYLAYGFSQMRLQTKKDSTEIAALLVGGRRWAEDQSGAVPRPTFRSEQFNVPELSAESSGSCFEIMLGDSPGERPKDLGWIGARNAKQWLAVLKIKTPLGGVYLTTPPYRPEIHLTVVDPEGSRTAEISSSCDYYYPHEIEGKVKSLSEIDGALERVVGDANTKFTKLSSDFKKLDCIYEIWTKEEIVDPDGDFAALNLSEADLLLVERHNVVIYGAFLSSAKQWHSFSDEILRLRKGIRIMQGGLQLATDGMIQGDSLVIPLTSAIGYQNNSHIIVHFTDGNPDMGRKVFQPELKALAERLAVRVVTVFRRYLQHRKPEAGPASVLASRALHEWRKAQEAHADARPLLFKSEAGSLKLISEPQQEQDVVALFHQLLALDAIRGYRIYATSQNETYDSLFAFDYGVDGLRFSKIDCSLGVNERLLEHGETDPKVLEYKHDFDGLVEDFENNSKSAQHIDLVVCWSVGKEYKDSFYLKPLLIGDEGAERQFFAATHQVFSESSGQMHFEVIVLSDLLRHLLDPEREEARQRVYYADA